MATYPRLWSHPPWPSPGSAILCNEQGVSRLMSFLASREAFAPSGIGKSVPRREDVRLLAGKGRYAADFNFPAQVFAYVLRSPHAHAQIAAIAAAPATARPGVL